MKLATVTTAIAATAAAALLPSPSAFGCSRVLENKYDTVCRRPLDGAQYLILLPSHHSLAWLVPQFF